MSTIEKLSILGIRSFGTKANDQQSLNFSSPVTLILGANGCGKTTIIECLKYALTGEVPPGSNKGQNFVHDPKIFDYTECLGKVQLKVKNVRGEYLTVTRAMKAGISRGKMVFKTLDATVNFENEQSNQLISKRCIDVDTEMCQFMGVSKAIINNVLFCHQEDASWPLDEAKKLKEKFDAIFGTTQYNKTIDKFIKMQKEQTERLKLEKTKLAHASEWKNEGEKKRLELEKYKSNLNKLEEVRAAFEEEMKPIEQRLDQILKIETNIAKIQSKRIQLSTELKSCQEQMAKLESKIKTVFDGSIAKLDTEIRKFRNEASDRQSTLSNVQDELNLIKEQQKKVQQNITELDRKSGGLIQKRQQEQETIADRAAKISELCNKLSITRSNNLEEANPSEIQNLLQQIKVSLKGEEKKIADKSAIHDKLDQEKQKQIDKLRENKTKVESDISSKRTQNIQNEKDLSKYETEIIKSESAASQLVNITSQLDEIEAKYRDFEQSINFQEKKAEIQSKKQNVEKLQKQFKELDEKLRIMNLNSKITAEITLKTKDMEKKENEIRRVKNKHSENMKKIIPNRQIESNFKRAFQLAYDDTQKKIKELNQEINSKQLKEKGLQIERKTLKENVSKWEKDLEDSKEQVYERCQSTPYEELLARCKENIEKYQLEHGALKSSESMFKKYIRKIQSDPCCPLCHKDMTSIEASDLSTELTDEIQHLPENIKRAGNDLKKEQIKYENLLSLRPIIEKINRFEKDIPKEKINLRNCEQQLAQLSGEIEVIQNSTNEPNNNLNLINNILGDMSLLDESMKDSTRLQADIQKLKEKLPEGSSSTSVEDVELEKATVLAELEDERKIVENLSAEYEEESDHMNKLRENRSRLHDLKNKLQEGVQNLPQLKNQRDEMAKKIATIKNDIKNLENQLEPLKIQLESEIDEKIKLQGQNRTALNKLQNSLDDLRKINHDIDRYSKVLSDLSGLNLVNEINRIKIQSKKLKEEQNLKEQEYNQTVQKIDKIKEEISNQELIERNLKDNRDLKELVIKEEGLKEEYESLANHIGGFNYDAGERKVLTKKREDIQIQTGKTLGQIGEINGQIEKMQRELDSPKFKEAVKTYMKQLYQVEVLKHIIFDLGKYRKALEWALLKFHSEKMSKINRLIREYWRQIYRGNDIDFIEILTDEVDTSESVDKKRSYNYRVVQSKNNSKIDMRGRCSAGQRVLASLIIRMALAETFSISCGVLALDEPTTNLDRNNILSLCEALNRIVEDRQTQSNFMLIIITHDEQFISTLGKIESYYKVSRDDDGKSEIRKVRIYQG